MLDGDGASIVDGQESGCGATRRGFDELPSQGRVIVDWASR